MHNLDLRRQKICKNRPVLNFKTIFFMILFLTFSVMAFDPKLTDQNLIQKLKSDLQFDIQRKSELSQHKKSKRIYETEREKGLALYLEEQEKWDISREKGLNEQHRYRLKNKEMDELSSEYKADQKNKKSYDLDQEIFRKQLVDTKNKITRFYENKATVTELEELEIYNQRPRFSTRARGKNKFVKKDQADGSSSPSSGSAWTAPADSGSMPAYDYPPSGMSGGDYIPTDNFDDLPPPPPLVPYDGYNGSVPAAPPNFNDNSDFGGFPPQGSGFPQQPPDGGWDF